MLLRHKHTWWTKRSSPPVVGVIKPNLRRHSGQPTSSARSCMVEAASAGRGSEILRNRRPYPLVASNHFTEPVAFVMTPPFV